MLAAALAASTLLLIHLAYKRPLTETPPRKTFSLHPLLPSFISGMYAAYKLGVDETQFLLLLREGYGDTVYMPFPMNLHLVLDDAIIRDTFSGTYNKQMSFTPPRKDLSTTIFGLAKSITSPNSMQLDKHIFPVHAKAMTKPRLAKAVVRFQQAIYDAVKDECSSWTGDKSVDLVDWTFTLMFKASLVALFGEKLDLPLETFMKCFQDFDAAFPLLASEKIPKFVQSYFPGVVGQGVRSRDHMIAEFAKWARETGCAGLEVGDVIKDVADEGARLGFGDYDIGSCMLGDFWPLVANNPFAVTWIVIYLIQCENAFSGQVMAEIDNVDCSVMPPAEADLPLLTSVIYETLRLQTSVYTKRQAWSKNEEPVHMKSAKHGAAAGHFDPGLWVHPGEQVLLATRLGHLDPNIWGETAGVWDGRRFYDGPFAEQTELGTSKARRIPEIKAFGGGQSMVSRGTL